MELAFFLMSIAGLLITPLLLRLAWLRRRQPLAVPLALQLITVVISSITNLLLLMPSLAPYMVWQQHLKISLIQLTGPIWFWIVYEYIHAYRLRPRGVLLLLLPSSVILMIYWTNAYHGWLFPLTPTGIDTAAFTPLRVLNVTYHKTLFIIASVWIAKFIYQKNQQWLPIPPVLVLFYLPIIFFWLYDFKILPFPFGGPILLLVLVPLVLHFRLLDIVPVARDKLADHISDGFAVLNANRQIVDSNATAAQVLALSPNQRRNLPRPVPLPEHLSRQFDWSSRQQQRQTVHFSAPQALIRDAEARLSPLLDNKRRIVGYSLLLHDTAQRL